MQERHDRETLIPVFKDGKGETTVIPMHRKVIDFVSKQGYQLWLDRLIKGLNSTVHP